MNESTFVVIRDTLLSSLQLDIYSEAFNSELTGLDTQKVREIIESGLLTRFASMVLKMPEVLQEIIVIHDS